MNKNIDQILVKALEKDLSAEEKILFDEWMKEEKNQQEFLLLKQQWEKPSSIPSFSVDEGLQLLQQKVEVPTKTKTRSLYNFWKLSAAAMLLIIPFASYLFSQKDVQEIINTTNSNMIVTLEDGTNVHLYPKASLTYESPLSDQNKRSVQLIGSAFFKVKSDADHPFYVYSNQLETKVTGTTFEVIEDEAVSKVSLIEGKVKVKKKSDDNYINIKPNESFVMQGTNTQIMRFSSEQLLFEKDHNSLWFQEASIDEVAKRLYEAYRIKLVYEHSLNEVKLNAKIKNASLQKVMRIIELSLDVSVRQDGNLYYLKEN
ncbi:FecR domain-containing protein [Flammeovirga yaeyamensis]|uniref:FecR domain-containing protein n=1 Tax=Flammeovirga yaeyamensis TaxID=367791 RepID=A0AAX1N7I7_9BACT|nr:FecR family protein [Flammeovirga yaeyamensis]MBB3700561.1 ferric-dicitrate binding protein FerR (iron transport regulator) [Flammeovirga yaeyamensis]NMF37678.1 FecR family protein [Flammeovirga yaeyamensis]QWG01987.1 FecR domain-containing protein [Flammeovirga yaeyamensis]